MANSFQEKVIVSSSAAAIFAIVSLPSVYHYIDSILNGISLNNCPTSGGKFIHTIVFLLLNFVVMKISNSQKSELERKSDALLFKYALYGSLIFYVIADNDTYTLTSCIGDQVFGVELANKVGQPNATGVFAHALVYLVALVGVMYLPKDQ